MHTFVIHHKQTPNPQTKASPTLPSPTHKNDVTYRCSLHRAGPHLVFTTAHTQPRRAEPSWLLPSAPKNNPPHPNLARSKTHLKPRDLANLRANQTTYILLPPNPAFSSRIPAHSPPATPQQLSLYPLSALVADLPGDAAAPSSYPC